MKSQFITFLEYRDINKNFPENKDLYHDLDWLQLIQNSFNVSIKPLLTSNDHNEIISLTPFFHLKKGPFSLLGSPIRGLYTEYLGSIYRDKLSIEEKSEAIKSQHNLLLKNADYIEWGFHNFLELNDYEYINFDQLGYSCIPKKSLLIDLSGGESDVWGRFTGNARNMIRKSEKMDVMTKLENPDDNWINMYYSMLQDTFSKQGNIVPHPKSFFFELRSLIKSKKIYFLSSYIGDEIVANAIFLLTNQRMVYLSGTSNEKGLKSASNSSIQWMAIKTAINEGITNYDMGGLGVKSIDRFKRSFGGKEITTYRWIHRKSLYAALEPIAKHLFKLGWIKI